MQLGKKRLSERQSVKKRKRERKERRDGGGRESERERPSGSLLKRLYSQVWDWNEAEKLVLESHRSGRDHIFGPSSFTILVIVTESWIGSSCLA